MSTPLFYASVLPFIEVYCH